ncbi:MAG: hypothetical protein K2Y25_13710 [Pseudomonadaceae bacterium]|nr:hypothetical protein [Pseudomonadaceae bacterium]
MQVAGASSNLPISTQIINKTEPAAQVPGAPVNPEQINRAVDRAADKVSDTQASRAQTQTDRRTYAAQLYSSNSQQKQIDTYLAVASEGKVDSTSGSTLTPQQLLESFAAKDRLDISNAIDPQRPDLSAPRPQPYVEARA